MDGEPFEGRQITISQVYLCATFNKISRYYVVMRSSIQHHGAGHGIRPGRAFAGHNVKLLGPCWAQHKRHNAKWTYCWAPEMMLGFMLGPSKVER